MNGYPCPFSSIEAERRSLAEMRQRVVELLIDAGLPGGTVKTDDVMKAVSPSWTAPERKSQ